MLKHRNKQKQPAPEADSASRNDRISFTTILAVVVHGLIIFGVGFTRITPPTSTEIDVTLATNMSTETPDAADFLAQFNQEGSGTEREVKQITTDQVADFNDNIVNEITPPPQIKRQQANNPEQAVIAAARGDESVDNQAQAEDEKRQDGTADQTIFRYRQELASLEAKLAREKQDAANRPVTKRLTQVSARASEDASYLLGWVQQVEQVGDANFPEQALANKITGSTRLLVIINSHGELIDVAIRESSGHAILDEAARQIVRLGAPYQPLPKSFKADRLEIIRTMTFDISGLTIGD